MKKFNFILLVSALLTNACSELPAKNDPDTLCNPDIESCDSNDDNNSNDEVSCKDTEHLFADGCESDDLNHCGTHTNDCTQMPGWNSGQCIEKACIAETCQPGYHIYNNTCEEDSITNCGTHGMECNVANASNACVNGACIFTCDAGYENLNDACVINNNDSFITIWTTTYSNQKIQFPVQENAGNLTIDWGDGTMTENISTSKKFVSHKYITAGEYTITVRGNINAWSCKDDSWDSTCAQLAGIQSYGNTQFGQYAFYKAENLTNLPASDTPQFKNNDMTGAFYRASQFNQDISYWDTSKVTNMYSMFSNASKFNQPLNDWDTSNVTYMTEMFGGAHAFNQPLNDWDTSNVTAMNHMFTGAIAFNQPLNDWDTSKVTNMSSMFFSAYAFNQPLNDWDTSKVTDMFRMFSRARAFNQPLNNWDTSNVTDMSYMFSDARAFNQPLNNWDISKVTYMTDMFSYSGLNKTNYCALMSSPYSSYWKKYNLGISYKCP